jgi:hypothetical protein
VDGSVFDEELSEDVKELMRFVVSVNNYEAEWEVELVNGKICWSLRLTLEYSLSF